MTGYEEVYQWKVMLLPALTSAMALGTGLRPMLHAKLGLLMFMMGPTMPPP